MSRHFNYEIDERRVRLLLKENSIPFENREWETYLKDCKPVQTLPKLPSLSLPSFAVSKSTFLTVVFVVLVGSFTWLIARFVDFSNAKSNSEIIREVKPEPENVQLPPQKPEEIKSLTPVVENSSPLRDTVESITNTVIINSETQNPPAGETNESSNKSLAEQGQALPKMAVNNKDTTTKTNRKKLKKQVETMEAKPMTTEIPLMPQEEPELELK